MIKRTEMIMKRFYTLFAVAALMLAACAEPEPEQPVVPTPTPDEEAEQQKPAVYFTYGGEADETRTAIGSQNNGTTRFVWVAGDKVGVSCKELNAYNRTVTVPANPNPDKEYFDATFNTYLQFKDETTPHTFYLYYPYSANSSASSTVVEGTIPSLQDGDMSKSDFMWDIVTTTAANPKVSSKMIHPHAYLRFYVVDVNTKNDKDAATSIEGEKISAISIVGDGALTGTFKVDLSTFSKDAPYAKTVNFTNVQSNAATLNYPAGAAYNTVIDQAGWTAKTVEKNHPVMVVNPDGISGKNFTIDVAIEGMPTFEAKLSGKTIKSGKFYNIGLGALKQTDGTLKLTVIGWTEVQGEVTFN